jgi:hypothetical protein
MQVTLRLKGQKACGGKAEGEALVSDRPFKFMDADPDTGTIFAPGEELHGKSTKDKVMVFPCGCGPSNEEWSLYIMKSMGGAPKAVINHTAYPSLVIGAIIASVPMVYGLDENCLRIIETGDRIKVDADEGVIEVTKTGK